MRVILVLLSWIALGCAGSGAIPATGAAPGNPQNVLLREEIVTAGVGNMQDAIQRLRPQFLRTRGQTNVGSRIDQVAVLIDNVRVGEGEDTLRTIGTSGVLRVEYVNARDTTFRFGSSYAAGVIHIITK
jgi:hypothetical protein